LTTTGLVERSHAGLETGVENLFGRGRKEEDADLAREDEQRQTGFDRFDAALQVTDDVDRIVVTRGDAQSALDARLLVYAELVPGDGDRFDRADPHTRHARRAFVVDRELETHVPPGPFVTPPEVTLKSRYRLAQQLVAGLQETYPGIRGSSWQNTIVAHSTSDVQPFVR